MIGPSKFFYRAKITLNLNHIILKEKITKKFIYLYYMPKKLEFSKLLDRRTLVLEFQLAMDVHHLHSSCLFFTVVLLCFRIMKTYGFP